MKILGIDYGTRTLGLSGWDSSLTFPLPKPPLRVQNDREALARIKALLREDPVDRIVLGLPQTPDPEKSWIVKRIRAFGRALEEATGVPVDFVSEDFSTREAAAASPRNETDDTVDSLAATRILETYLRQC